MNYVLSKPRFAESPRWATFLASFIAVAFLVPIQVDCLFGQSAASTETAVAFEKPAGLSSLANQIRPPAVPLITCDPYFSIWSPANKLFEADTTHWTGKPHRIESQLLVDGKPYRLMGLGESKGTGEVECAKQNSVLVLPTRTIYQFATPEVQLDLTFCTPALPSDMDLLSWPLTYVTYAAQSTDGKAHQVQINFSVNGEVAVNVSNQPFSWSKPQIDGLSTIAVGSDSQAILATSGDDLRIDWGHFYLSAKNSNAKILSENKIQLNLGEVTSQPKSVWLMVAYDDLYSIQYMMKNLRPYWRRDGRDAAALLSEAAERYNELIAACETFDHQLMNDLGEAGGTEYALLCALAYRQCFAAGKFVADENGQPLQFSKENHSNGCIATSDVFYPMAPQFLLFGPTLAKSFVVPFMNYAASDRWKFPFAPHDLGTYPHANGQVYGGGERSEENQMPVEESGNMLILMAAIAQMEGNADFASLYWPQLSQWAAYLKDKGFDPENQLCTDDFAGHMAHNVNLSAKAIMGLGSYARLCELRGESDTATEYRQLAQRFADRWVKEANDGDHYRLAFDQQGTWSQKYNLIWDRILDLNLFPREVAQTEMAYYKKIQNKFGLPLDNRADYTKLDWITWTATLNQNRDDFQLLISPIIQFINETPDRSPLTDWYQTKSAQKRGFTARPVVGGVFAQMLYSKELWSKWAGQDKTAAGNWAPMPKMPTVVPVVPAAHHSASDWFYTTEKPDTHWFGADFDASKWKTGKSGFGTRDTPGTSIGTQWKTDYIWLLRDFDLPEGELADWLWYLHHDESAEVYVNGELVLQVQGYSTNYQMIPFSDLARKILKPGKNRIAVHCHQTSGGQYIDIGIVRLETKQ